MKNRQDWNIRAANGSERFFRNHSLPLVALRIRLDSRIPLPHFCSQLQHASYSADNPAAMVSRRNLIIILPHGLRSDAVGDANTWPLLTPNLESLAKRGLRLVAGSACPADWGAQVSLLTGLHARQHGHLDQSPLPQLPPVVEGWPAWLHDHGYHTAGVGLVHAMLPWLDESVLVDPVDVTEPGRCAYLASLHGKGQLRAVQQQRKQRLRFGPFEPDRLLLQPDEDVDGFIYNHARQMLAELPDDQPWVLVVMFTGPANDLAPPVMYADAVDPRLLEHGYALADFKLMDGLVELDYPRVQLQRLDPIRLARIRADYLGRVTLIDFGISRITAQLNKRPDRDRTWIVLAGDHGQLLGEHGLIGHRSFLSAALETPILVTPPKLMKQKLYDTALISTVDVAPTIAELAGVDVPPNLTGRSLVPLLKNHSIPSPIASGGGLLSEFGKRLMLETERFKVIFNTQNHQAIALYDMLNDAGEKQNLIRDNTGLNMLDSLRWRLGDALLPLRAQPVNLPHA